MNQHLIKVYTDGSCHTQLKIGTWAAIIFVDQKKVVLSGTEIDTTHNRMELLAIIKSIEFLKNENLASNEIVIFTDSQYAVNLPFRKEKLELKAFATKKGKDIQNLDLVKLILEYFETLNIVLNKVKAHSLDGDAFNREVDLLVRNTLRKTIHP